MKQVPTPLKRHQSATALAMSSGPLSKRTRPGGDGSGSEVSLSELADDLLRRMPPPLGHDRDEEVNALTRSYRGAAQVGWWDRIRPHSLGWVTAHLADGTVIGFVNVAWDGSDHVFLLDTKTRQDHQRRGIATGVVRLAAENAKQAGCEWLHVDFEDTDGMAAFYFDACGFRPTAAGLIHLSDTSDQT